MFLLEFFEEKLGTLALWPTYVLRLLFVDAPTFLVIASFAAFCYGNSVPLNAALSLYLMCHHRDHALITRLMTECYDKWCGTPPTPWDVIYFNMSEQQHRFVNGSVLPVRKEVSTTGFDSTVGLTHDVERKLELARQCPYIPGSLYCLLQDLVLPVRRELFPE
jgi:hypothetical protein